MAGEIPLTIDSGEITIDSGVITIDEVDIDALTSSFSAAQYGQAARNLLPSGRAWNREDGANQARFCDALGEMYAQQDLGCVQMLSDFFPATATQGIDEWNASLGLPDSCMGPPANLAANQQQITSRLISTGGQSTEYYIQIAAALGFVITITEFSSTHIGSDPPAGFIVNSSDWAHSFRVNIMNAGTAPAGALLACLLNRYKPAHTQFYIVDGSSPTTTTRLFEVADDVSESLRITIPAS